MRITRTVGVKKLNGITLSIGEMARGGRRTGGSEAAWPRCGATWTPTFRLCCSPRGKSKVYCCTALHRSDENRAGLSILDRKLGIVCPGGASRGTEMRSSRALPDSIMCDIWR